MPSTQFGYRCIEQLMCFGALGQSVGGFAPVGDIFRVRNLPVLVRFGGFIQDVVGRPRRLRTISAQRWQQWW